MLRAHGLSHKLQSLHHPSPPRGAAAGAQPLHFSFGCRWASWRHFRCRLAGSGKPVDPGLGLKEKPCPSREGPRAGEPRLWDARQMGVGVTPVDFLVSS